LADKFGRRVLQVGSLFQILGVVAIWVALDQMDEFSIWPLVAGMALVGFGTGLVVAALFDIILASVDTKEIGSASGVLTAVQSIGAAVGVAIFGTVFFTSAKIGEAIEGFKGALVVELVLVVFFLILTPMLPKKAVENPAH
jgi:MFS family permease